MKSPSRKRPTERTYKDYKVVQLAMPSYYERRWVYPKWVYKNGKLIFHAFRSEYIKPHDLRHWLKKDFIPFHKWLESQSFKNDNGYGVKED